MIEKTILKYLLDKLDVPVFLEEPTDKSESYIIVEKTSQSNLNLIKTSTIAIQSYGSSLLNAAELNEKVISVMSNMISLDIISKVTLNSAYNFTDTETKRYRYQAVFHIVHYA